MKHKWKRLFLGNQKGMTLIECLIAVALLAAMGGAFLSALTTSTNATGLVEEKVDIDHLARTQLEYTKTTPYTHGATSYPIIDDIPSGYSIEVGVTDVGGDEDIQEVTVVVKAGTETLLTIAGYKVNR